MAQLNHQQQHALSIVEVLTDDMATARRALKKQIEEEFDRQYEELKRKRSRAANEAYNLGVSKTKLGRAIGSSDWSTVNALLALTADEFTPEAQTEVISPIRITGPNDEWEYNRETLTLTFHRWYRQDLKWFDTDAVVQCQMIAQEGYEPTIYMATNQKTRYYFEDDWIENALRRIRVEEGLPLSAQDQWDVDHGSPGAEPGTGAEDDIVAQMWAQEYVEEKDDW